jgi:methionyl aminopeptidase
MQSQQSAIMERTHDRTIVRERAPRIDRPQVTQVARSARRIELRSHEQIELIARAGAVVSDALGAAAKLARPGATTAELNDAAATVIRRAGARSLFLNYPTYHRGEGFPAVCCISINEEVVHGIPGPRQLADGDLVTIDCGVEVNGWCADAARTVAVGEPASTCANLLAATEAMLELAIELARPGTWWSRIAERLQRVADDSGFGVVREYVGHGIGRQLHEAPQVPAYRMTRRDKDFQLVPGMVLAIEPMVTLGVPATKVLSDGWTVVTTDGRPACHVEHTIAITERGPRVLTAPAAMQGSDLDA